MTLNYLQNILWNIFFLIIGTALGYWLKAVRVNYEEMKEREKLEHTSPET